jgi:DNA topoisomerase-3
MDTLVALGSLASYLFGIFAFIMIIIGRVNGDSVLVNNYLKNPFKDEKTADSENDDEDYKAIFKGLELGTEATRTGIIDNAKKSKYISLNKDVYRIEKGGKFLIEQLVDMNISMDKYKTSQLGQALKRVYRGEITIDDSVDIAKKEIQEVFNGEVVFDTGVYGEKIGVCPICNKDVVRGKFAYGCVGAKEGCEFRISLKILDCIINKEQAKNQSQRAKDIARYKSTGLSGWDTSYQLLQSFTTAK